LVVDKNGLHVFSGTGEFVKTVKPKGSGTIYGVLPFRCNNGSVCLVIEEGTDYKYVWYDAEISKVILKCEIGKFCYFFL
jgi:hypothetical protein